MKPFTKIIHPGRAPDGEVFCKIEFDGGKLSITGVIGPKHNGDSTGGCGQIDMGFHHRNQSHNDKRTSKPVTTGQMRFSPGWTADEWLDFLDYWHTWHLNDMRPGCEHQVGPDWDSSREVTLYYFRLTDEAQQAIRNAKKRAEGCIKSGGTFSPLPSETILANLPDKITRATPEAPEQYTANGPQYPGDHYNKASEVKTAGWVHPEEHPDGLLCKPCPVCGYKYGSEWRNQEVPEGVLSWLAGLPSTDIQPAWV